MSILSPDRQIVKTSQIIIITKPIPINSHLQNTVDFLRSFIV